MLIPYVIENHDEALEIIASAKSKMVIHVDAHIDYYPACANDPITIANYLSHCFLNNDLDRLIWVIPDGAFTKHYTIKYLGYLFQNSRIIHKATCIKIILSTHKEVMVIPMKYIDDILMQSAEPFVLDIDIDYFSHANTKFDFSNLMRQCALSDIYQFWKQIMQYHSNIEKVIIAKSILGGYTLLEEVYKVYYLESLFINNNENSLFVEYNDLILTGETDFEKYEKFLFFPKTQLSCISRCLRLCICGSKTAELFQLFVARYPKYYCYLNNFYQMNRMGLDNIINRELKKYNIFGERYTLYWEVRTNRKQSYNSLEMSYYSIFYKLHRKQYVQALELCKWLHDELKDQDYADWEEPVSSHQYTLSTTSSRAKLFKYISICYFGLHDWRKAYLFTNKYMISVPDDLQIKLINEICQIKLRKHNLFSLFTKVYIDIVRYAYKEACDKLKKGIFHSKYILYSIRKK